MSNDDERPKKSLRRAVERVAQGQVEDELDRQARRALERERLNDSETNRELRKDYASKIFKYLVGYSGGSFLLLALHGFSFLGFQLDSTVLGLIVGSTAVSAIGLVGIVARSLFRSLDK